MSIQVMISEMEIYKSMGLSLLWTGALVYLALHLNWDIVDLCKCFYLVLIFSTLQALLLFTLTVDQKTTKQSLKASPPDQERLRYVLSGQHGPKNKKTTSIENKSIRLNNEMSRGWRIITFPLVLFLFIILAAKIIEFGDHFFDILSRSINNWPERDRSLMGIDLLIDTAFDYLPFTALLLLSLCWDTYRRYRTINKSDLAEGAGTELLGYVYLIVGLHVTLRFLPMILDETALYYALIGITFLPYQNFLYLLGRAHGGY